MDVMFIRGADCVVDVRRVWMVVLNLRLRMMKGCLVVRAGFLCNFRVACADDDLTASVASDAERVCSLVAVALTNAFMPDGACDVFDV